MELRLLLAVSRRLPRLRGSGRLGHHLARFYRRQSRPPVVADVLGFRMCLDPMEYVDGDLLFVPQICERRERRVLEDTLRPGDLFLDVGCHTGFYSLFAARLVGPRGMVYAIDADRHAISTLTHNVSLNRLTNIVSIHAGVTDRREVLPFGINLRGNRGASSFCRLGQHTEHVQCYPLLDVLVKHDVREVRAAKLDIEELGYTVLKRFFAEAPEELLPHVLIVEKEGGLREFLLTRGYSIVAESGLNWILKRHD